MLFLGYCNVFYQSIQFVALPRRTLTDVHGVTAIVATPVIVSAPLHAIVRLLTAAMLAMLYVIVLSAVDTVAIAGSVTVNAPAVVSALMLVNLRESVVAVVIVESAVEIPAFLISKPKWFRFVTVDPSQKSNVPFNSAHGAPVFNTLNTAPGPAVDSAVTLLV